MGKPVDLWTKRDVELVQRDSIYTNSNHPRQQAVFDKVRRHFEREYDRPQAERGGGPVQVRPYTRDDGTAVDGHSRAAPALRGR